MIGKMVAQSMWYIIDLISEVKRQYTYFLIFHIILCNMYSPMYELITYLKDFRDHNIR